MTTTAEPRIRDLMRWANDMMWDSLAQGRDTDLIAFLCECADPKCYQAVWLTSAEYERARSDPDWCALQRGHVAATPEADVSQR